MSVSKDEVSDLIRENNKQLMDSFKDLLADTVGQIKRSNEDSAEQQMKEIKKLKYDEPHKFKKNANEDQVNFNRKLAEKFWYRQVCCREWSARESKVGSSGR